MQANEEKTNVVIVPLSVKMKTGRFLLTPKE
jgi:hypothetical protein